MSKRKWFAGIFIKSVCCLYALLFVYAAMSKLLDFENFGRQLGQSPMLSAFAGWISWLVPGLEIGLALLLFVSQLRLIALFASYLLMGMFTVYIYILLHYSAFVPCSCGGILESLTWNEHMVFNTVFLLIAAIAILLYPSGANFKNFRQL